jgi:hypothetical protein
VDDGLSLGVGLTPVGTLADLYTAAMGEDVFTSEEVSGFWRFAGVIPWVSEIRKSGNVIDAALDVTGKVHGRLPQAQDLARYSLEDLARLRDELQISVQTRIARTVEMGADYGHNARLAEEQQLLQSIEKHLKDR